MRMVQKINPMFTYGIVELMCCGTREMFRPEKEPVKTGRLSESVYLVRQGAGKYRHGEAHQQITDAHQILSAGAIYVQ